MGPLPRHGEGRGGGCGVKRPDRKPETGAAPKASAAPPLNPEDEEAADAAAAAGVSELSGT